jgi:uncharacterized protein
MFIRVPLDNHPMGRLLVAVVLVVLAVWMLRRALRGPDPGAGADGGRAAPPSATQGELVRCAQCGVHLPRVEARMTGERFYCSDEHARLGPAAGPGTR